MVWLLKLKKKKRASSESSRLSGSLEFVYHHHHHPLQQHVQNLSRYLRRSQRCHCLNNVNLFKWSIPLFASLGFSVFQGALVILALYSKCFTVSSVLKQGSSISAFLKVDSLPQRPWKILPDIAMSSKKKYQFLYTFSVSKVGH